MPTNVWSAPCASVPTTARAKTTAPWIRFWWAPTSAIPPWTSAPTARPSAESNPAFFEREPQAVPFLFFLDRDSKIEYDIFKYRY